MGRDKSVKKWNFVKACSGTWLLFFEHPLLSTMNFLPAVNKFWNRYTSKCFNPTKPSNYFYYLSNKLNWTDKVLVIWKIFMIKLKNNILFCKSPQLNRYFADHSIRLLCKNVYYYYYCCCYGFCSNFTVLPIP